MYVYILGFYFVGGSDAMGYEGTVLLLSTFCLFIVFYQSFFSTLAFMFFLLLRSIYICIV
jgi:hypothetical protein